MRQIKNVADRQKGFRAAATGAAPNGKTLFVKLSTDGEKMDIMVFIRRKR